MKTAIKSLIIATVLMSGAAFAAETVAAPTSAKKHVKHVKHAKKAAVVAPAAK
jgi:hypothetical protein